eukprot:371302-Rhodomonas_salina.1
MGMARAAATNPTGVVKLCGRVLEYCGQTWSKAFQRTWVRGLRFATLPHGHTSLTTAFRMVRAPLCTLFTSICTLLVQGNFAR